MGRFNLNYTLKSDLSLVRPAAAMIIEELKRRLPAEEEKLLSDIRLCLEEALINAIKHGNRQKKELEVKVRVEYSSQGVEIFVKDQGLGFDPDKVPDPTKDDNLQKLSGRGLFLIKKLMDKVGFFDGGRTIFMLKYLSKKEGEHMEIKDEIVEGVLVCELKGEINLDTSPRLRKVFDKAMGNENKKVVVDFSGVTYIDSSGLATLIEMMQKVNKIGGEMRIASLSEKVRSIFEITKLDKLFKIYPSRKEALENFSASQ